MANQVISMQQIRALIQLLEKGCSLRSISAQLGISRQPVTLYAALLKNANYTFQELRQLSDNDLSKIVYTPAPEVVYPDIARREDFTARIPYFLTDLNRTGVTR